MLAYLLKNSDFSGLLRFVSPQFFKVISPTDLAHVVRHATSSESAQLAKEQLARIDRVCVDAFPSSELGERALTIFFHQIFTTDTWVLDFRPRAFTAAQPGMMSWTPKPYAQRVRADFLRGVRSLYRGFYGGDDALFESALTELGLLPARAALRRHFGEGDQTRVEFRLRTFQNTFAEVFEACAREKLTLQSEFLVLGLMLLGLYETLESLGKPFDVRACFERVLADTEGR